MRRLAPALAFSLLVGCGGAAASTPPPARAATAATAAIAIAVPEGWTDLLAASRDDLEARLPGLYDKIQELHAVAHVKLFAWDLREGSPSRGARMTLIPLPFHTTVDDALLEAMVEESHHGLPGIRTVEKARLSVRGQPMAKWHVEYDRDDGAREGMLNYIFEQGDQLVQLDIRLRAADFASLRPLIESIEGGGPSPS
jgi:hypothetical protein